MLPSRHSQGVGTRMLGFRSSITQPINASVYASPAASRRPTQDSRSGWSRCSFPVTLFPPLQHAGFIPAHGCPLASPLNLSQFAFLADENIQPAVVAFLQQRGIAGWGQRAGV